MVIIPCWPKLAQVLPQNGLGIYLIGRMAVRIGGLNEEVLGRPRVKNEGYNENNRKNQKINAFIF